VLELEGVIELVHEVAHLVVHHVDERLVHAQRLGGQLGRVEDRHILYKQREKTTII